MAGVTPVGAINAALQTEQVTVELQVRALRAQLHVVQEMGEEVLHLIEAAAIDPNVGQHLNVSI